VWLGDRAASCGVGTPSRAANIWEPAAQLKLCAVGLTKIMIENDKLANAVRGLTIAVWVLVALTAVQVAWTLWAWFRPQTFSSTEFETSSAVRSGGMTNEQIREDNEFSAYPPERKIERASLIVLTRYEKDGDRQKAVITEILKRTPDTRFFYNVGDEYHELSHMGTDHGHGDGQVAFLTGNPPRMNVSYSYEQERVGGLGHMPLAKIRELAQQSSTGSRTPRTS
jgi:hypothetical protein